MNKVLFRELPVLAKAATFVNFVNAWVLSEHRWSRAA